MATKPCPQRGVTGFGFPGPGRAAGTHKLEKLGCRPKAHCPGSQAPQAPARKPWKGGRSLGAHLPLPPALGWLLKPGALRRSQPCVWRAVSCGVGGMGVRRDSGSGSRMQARNPETLGSCSSPPRKLRMRILASWGVPDCQHPQRCRTELGKQGLRRDTSCPPVRPGQGRWQNTAVLISRPASFCFTNHPGRFKNYQRPGSSPGQ